MANYVAFLFPKLFARLQHAVDDGNSPVAALRPQTGGQGMSTDMISNSHTDAAPAAAARDPGAHGPHDRLWPRLFVCLALMFAPFLFPDVRAQEVAARICVFIVLVASYDLLIGYTGIVSFAHTMFFGLGAYGTAIAAAHDGARVGRRSCLGGGAGVLSAVVLCGADRPAVAQGQGDLLCHGHPGCRLGDDGAGPASCRNSPAARTGSPTRSPASSRRPTGWRTATRDVIRLFGVALTGRVALYYFRVLLLPGPVPPDAAHRRVAAGLRAAGGAREHEMRAEGDRLPGWWPTAPAIFCIAPVIAALVGGGARRLAALHRA